MSCCPIVHSTKGQHNLLLSQISILGLLQQAQSPPETPELGGWGPEKRLCSDSSELGQDLQLHQPGWAQLASRHSLERAPLCPCDGCVGYSFSHLPVNTFFAPSHCQEICPREFVLLSVSWQQRRRHGGQRHWGPWSVGMVRMD